TDLRRCWMLEGLVLAALANAGLPAPRRSSKADLAVLTPVVSAVSPLLCGCRAELAPKERAASSFAPPLLLSRLRANSKERSLKTSCVLWYVGFVSKKTTYDRQLQE